MQQKLFYRKLRTVPLNRILWLKERQTRLIEFDPCIVTTVYVKMKQEYSNKKGLSERKLRKRLEKHGWTVWRGGFLHAIRKNDLYPNVRKKYKILERLFETHMPGMFSYLQYLCKVHHGMPDFLCYRSGRFKFVECKLQYEPISERQKKCIFTLQRKGFIVEIHRLVDARTKTRYAYLNLYKKEKRIFIEQLTLRAKQWKRKR